MKGEGMAQRPGFNWGRLSMGSKGALIVGAVLFIVMLIPFWNDLDLAPIAGFEVPGGAISAFNGIGIVAGILVLALLVWEGLNAGGALANVTVPIKAVTTGLAAAAALFTLLRALIKPAGFSYAIGTWIGLILAVALGYVAWINWQEHNTMPGGAMPPPMPPA
jgi:DMSO/TMAO reductase YedYZ heme-binding membrane subunit